MRFLSILFFCFYYIRVWHFFRDEWNNLCDCFVSRGTMDDAQYYFEVSFLFVRQCFNPPKFSLSTFLKAKDLSIETIIVVFASLQYFFFSFSIINPVFSSLLKCFLWITFQGFLSKWLLSIVFFSLVPNRATTFALLFQQVLVTVPYNYIHNYSERIMYSVLSNRAFLYTVYWAFEGMLRFTHSITHFRRNIQLLEWNNYKTEDAETWNKFGIR